MTQTIKKDISLFNRFLNTVERVGNKLPHPIALFFIFAVATVLLSSVLSSLGFSAVGDLVNKATGKIETQTITVISLLNAKGLIYMLTSAEKNFISFAPLGTVLVAMLGVGIAESSGYIPALLKKTVAITPSRLITPVVIFLGVISNVASDTGYVILIPIGALMFKAYGRHPLAGLAAAFAGVSGGFSANLLIGTLDPLLSGISTEAVHILDINRTVEPTSNWYFLMVSTFVITIVGTLITDYIVEPRLGKYTGDDATAISSHIVTEDEEEALECANIVAILFMILLALLCVPAQSIFRNPTTGSLIAKAPLMQGIIIIIMLTFFLPSIVYGYKSGTFKDHRHVCAALGKAMSSLGPYMALCFVSAQFINYFNYTHLGTIIALKGAQFLKGTGIGGISLMVLFILFSAFINLFMGSASAKWTILSPIFIPMFMLLGYTPELTQVAYRIGDSCTNIITPLMSYYAMIITFAKKYDTQSGFGTLISTMLPYSMGFLVFWSLLLIVWMSFGLPVGPGAGLYLQ
jgi:aminobenzoyl-glutamate transport protein